MPDYDAINKLFDRYIQKRKILPNDPYDWEIWQQEVALMLKGLPSFTAIQIKNEQTDQKENIMSLVIDRKRKLSEKIDKALLQITTTPPTTKLSEGILLQITQPTESAN